mgnify:FL=1
MKEIVTTDEEVKCITMLICDRCHKTVRIGDDEYSEFICIAHTCGKGSIHGKNLQLSVDYCQHCFSKICFDHYLIETDSEPKNGIRFC